MRAGWGVRDPETGKDRKGERERQRSGEERRQGAGAEKRGAKSSGQRSRFKRGPSAQETLNGESKETDGTERGREGKAGDPHPDKCVWGRAEA